MSVSAEKSFFFHHNYNFLNTHTYHIRYMMETPYGALTVLHKVDTLIAETEKSEDWTITVIPHRQLAPWRRELNECMPSHIDVRLLHIVPKLRRNAQEDALPLEMRRAWDGYEEALLELYASLKKWHLKTHSTTDLASWMPQQQEQSKNSTHPNLTTRTDRHKMMLEETLPRWRQHRVANMTKFDGPRTWSHQEEAQHLAQSYITEPTNRQQDHRFGSVLFTDSGAHNGSHRQTSQLAHSNKVLQQATEALHVSQVNSLPKAEYLGVLYGNHHRGTDPDRAGEDHGSRDISSGQEPSFGSSWLHHKKLIETDKLLDFPNAEYPRTPTTHNISQVASENDGKDFLTPIKKQALNGENLTRFLNNSWGKRRFSPVNKCSSGLLETNTTHNVSSSMLKNHSASMGPNQYASAKEQSFITDVDRTPMQSFHRCQANMKSSRWDDDLPLSLKVQKHFMSLRTENDSVDTTGWMTFRDDDFDKY